MISSRFFYKGTLSAISRLCCLSVAGRLTILLLLFLIGCAGKIPAVISTPLEPSSKTTVSSLNETIRIVAEARIRLDTAEGSYPVQAVLILQRPSWLRLEILPLIGTPDFFLTATPDAMKILIPSQGTLYRGAPSAQNLDRFLPWAFSVEDLVRLFSGTWPCLSGKTVASEHQEDDGSVRLEISNSTGDSQSVWIGQNGQLTKVIRRSRDGGEMYQVVYEDYPPESPLARLMTISLAGRNTVLTVQYIDVRMEKATDMSVFDLTVAGEIKEIELD